MSGTATRPGSFQFYVEMREPEDDPEHCAGKRTQKQFTLRVRLKPWIVSAPAVPPRSEVGSPFTMRLRARGGSGIFAWSLTSGRLPGGIRLGRDGSITGTPRRPGTYRFEAKARDIEARSLRWAATISVAPRLRIRAQRLPTARVAQSYRAELATAGGVAPSVWRVAQGRLPRGIRLVSSAGRLTGTPKEAGAYLITIEAEDRLGVEHTRTFRIVVLERRKPPPTA